MGGDILIIAIVAIIGVWGLVQLTDAPLIADEPEDVKAAARANSSAGGSGKAHATAKVAQKDAIAQHREPS